MSILLSLRPWSSSTSLACISALASLYVNPGWQETRVSATVRKGSRTRRAPYRAIVFFLLCGIVILPLSQESPEFMQFWNGRYQFDDFVDLVPYYDCTVREFGRVFILDGSHDKNCVWQTDGAHRESLVPCAYNSILIRLSFYCEALRAQSVWCQNYGKITQNWVP